MRPSSRKAGGFVTRQRVERRLAAVLAADVAGYSRLMGADEVGTLEALKAHRRELIDPSIAAYKGRIVKTTGDGMLVEFASASGPKLAQADMARCRLSGSIQRRAAMAAARFKYCASR
jgi:class 3 adenylate cyclase